MVGYKRHRRKFMAPGLVMIVALVLAGCSRPSPAVHYYTFSLLPYPAEVSLHPTVNLRVTVAPVEVPTYLDRPHIVTRESLNTIQVAEYHRWASPLQEGLAWAVAENLNALLKSDQVVSGLDRAGAAYRVAINMHRFEGWPEGRFDLVATWTVRGTRGEQRVIEGRTALEEPITQTGVEGLVAAASRAVIALSRDLAEAMGDL